jgi:hypothetical protein
VTATVSGVLDRRRTHGLLYLAGTPLRVLDAARNRETLIPVTVPAGGAVATGLLCGGSLTLAGGDSSFERAPGRHGHGESERCGAQPDGRAQPLRGRDTSIRYMDYSWYMSMKRTNVYADPADLAIIKEAAKRRGISEAEIIRQGIHLAAMANRVWEEPLFSRTFEGPGRTLTESEVRDTVAEAVRRENGPGAGSAA